MKDYEHIVVWLDYFNKTLPRKKGRRLPKEKCIFDPSLKELIDATKAAGIEPTETEDKLELDKFVEAMKTIREEMLSDRELVCTAPHNLPVRRLDDVKAARELDLSWSASS